MISSNGNVQTWRLHDSMKILLLQLQDAFHLLLGIEFQRMHFVNVLVVKKSQIGIFVF